MRHEREGRGPDRAVAALGAVVGAIAITGCARCGPDPSEAGSSTGTEPGAAHALPISAELPPRTPPPSPWAFATVRGPSGVAAPERCRLREPPLRAKVPPGTHFVADPRAPGALVVADTQLDPPSVLRSGVLVFTAAPGATTGSATPPAPPSASAASGTATNGTATNATATSGAPGHWVPWPDARSAPRLARSGDQWVAAWETPPEGTPSRVTLYAGGSVESLGSGDAFIAADLACNATRCMLLTSRLGRVLPSGAEVVFLDATSFTPQKNKKQKVTIEPEGDSTARPFGIATLESPRGAIAVLTQGTDAVFWTTEGQGAPAPIARVPAEHGLLDALWLGDRPLVLAHGNVVDEHGCAREGADASGAKLRLTHGTDPPHDLRTPGAPTLVALRPLHTGALATWVAPLGCAAERRVVYAVVLDANGKPAGSPMPIADGETFALSVSGDDADLVIRRGEDVSWLRLECKAPE